MTATIVTIGDEILIGQVLDTNSQYIAKAFDRIGIDVHEMISISDDRNHILDTFSKLQDNTDFVLITGGLGPTKDDITKKTLAEYFDDELVSDSNVLAHVENLFHKFTGTKAPLLQTNIDQALVPSKATVLHNEFGTAPGMWLQKGGTVFISMPGVPYEMKGLIDTVVIPKIVHDFERPYIIHKTIMTYGMGESLLADKIADWENSLPDFIKLAYLPSPGRVRLRLSARGKDKQVLETALSEKIEVISKIIGDVIVGFEEDKTIEAVLGGQLAQKGLTVATAESCTGGKIAQIITSIPGSSKYYKGSIVSYSKDVKINNLGVSEQTIAQHSVVSAEVASEMADNVRKILKTDYGIGVTGNAGPTSDDTPEEIGVVFIAIATPNEIIAERFNFGQPREKVIDRAVNKSLEMLQKEILKNV
ncbi:CinA family nicotinamide mononucleotide deamidase-related protein [Flavobacterium sp. MAH-1]|uniref:CinA-like protein n=1 Tax=Flavobacterium agri TaxID=2743471 RepID=A0A7Y9C795_9FLAO|nr:CinA family nicotinamide mononucleotide deamidase-related protein [Flavobacterium agri]NUY81108.1 CinA family nicotinamide mononucleotide deamidase-related protein [Flavobacterium agri]NYA71132.1 CinA family nicotinamide mononucleotide deamidase-related protein [Flavobacterium agri]